MQARPCSSWALQGHCFMCHCLLPSLLCSPQGAERTAGMRLPVAGRHPDAFPWPQMFCSHGQGLDLLKQGLHEGTGCSASHSCLRIPGRNELCVLRGWCLEEVTLYFTSTLLLCDTRHHCSSQRMDFGETWGLRLFFLLNLHKFQCLAFLPRSQKPNQATQREIRISLSSAS